MGRTAICLSIALTFAAGAASRAETALEQLKRATGGNQTTGKTFDDSNKPQPSDAVPSGSVSVPTPTFTVPSSSGTASNFEVAPSTPTAKPPPRKGSEKAN